MQKKQKRNALAIAEMEDDILKESQRIYPRKANEVRVHESPSPRFSLAAMYRVLEVKHKSSVLHNVKDSNKSRLLKQRKP